MVELDAMSSVSGTVRAGCGHCLYLFVSNGFNAENYTGHTPGCSGLLLESTLKVRPYIFIYEPFKSGWSPQCFSPNSFWMYCTGFFFFYSALQRAAPEGFFRKTLYLYCFIKKNPNPKPQPFSSLSVVNVELSSCCNMATRCVVPGDIDLEEGTRRWNVFERCQSFRSS